MSIYLACCMMVKDEAKNILKSLKSVQDIVDSYIIFDTGSNDDTVSIIKHFCKSYNFPLYLKQGSFIDFAYSRNEMLDYADTIVPKSYAYLLLLDSNDELKEPQTFLTHLQQTQPNDALMLQQCWSIRGIKEKYWNVRCVKAHQGWRYRGRVHEWISKHNLETGERIHCDAGKAPPECLVFQTRDDDMEKSLKRFNRDYILLKQDFSENPTDSRICFYLAQTCGCLKNHQEAYYYYKLRTELKGFYEEIYHSYLRLGLCAGYLKHEWSEQLKWYLKAFDFLQRAEPLVCIAEHYFQTGNLASAYMYINQACLLAYPKQAILFVNSHAYEYQRYHLMAKIAYLVNQHAQGKKACEIAIKTGYNLQVDEKIYKLYTEKK